MVDHKLRSEREQTFIEKIFEKCEEPKYRAHPITSTARLRPAGRAEQLGAFN